MKLVVRAVECRGEQGGKRCWILEVLEIRAENASLGLDQILQPFDDRLVQLFLSILHPLTERL